MAISISPGVNLHGAGGLKPKELFDAVAFTFQRYEPVALAITNYNPERDPDSRTLNIVIQPIEHIVRLRRTAASR